MEVFTKNNASARGKHAVLLLADKRDRELCSDIIKDILSVANCAIFQISPEENVDISKFSASILIVSQKLIENRAVYIEVYNKLLSNHIPIIPIAVQPGIKNKFSKEFGKHQCITRNDNNNLERYYKGLSTQLKNLISSDEIIRNIKSAFSCHAFLSYRKSDSEKAKKVINFLRQHKKLNDAAIWYDEYLVPGTNYEKEIMDEIKNCDLFVLVITRNVLEKTINLEDGSLEDNYVVRVEYPLALKYHKPIIPIMVDSIDRDILMETFENIGDVITCGKKNELEKKIKQLNIDLKGKSEDDLYLQYLRGIAFINGIFTEIDVHKGIKILKIAASAGKKEAIAKLAQMYYVGDHIARNLQYASRYYKQLIDEVEKSGSIVEYPYCYNNYASTCYKSFNTNYLKTINIFETGINALRENDNDNEEYLFYFALTLAGYRNAIFNAMYDEVLGQTEEWKQKRDKAYEEAIDILDKLLQRDKFEEKYLGLKVTLEKKKAENELLPEYQYMYNKENNGDDRTDSIEKEIEEQYTMAINDLKILFDLNPLDTEEEYIELLYQAAMNLWRFDKKEKVGEWATECIKVCEKSKEGLLDEELNKKIDLFLTNAKFVLEYISMDLLSFIKKYNDYLKKSLTYFEQDIPQWLMSIEANYLLQNSEISGEILREIKQTITNLKNRKIRKEDHVTYVLLNLEYAYKGDVENNIISPDEYLSACGNFYASLDKRCALGNRMIDIAKELCMEGIGYKSALNCLNSAIEILTEAAKKNSCYYGDLKVAFYMRDNLERFLSTLNENKNLRIKFVPEDIVKSNEKGVHIVEVEN